MEEKTLYCMLIIFSEAWGNLVQISAQTLLVVSGIWTWVSPLQSLGILVGAPFNSFCWSYNTFVLNSFGDNSRK